MRSFYNGLLATTLVALAAARPAQESMDSKWAIGQEVPTSSGNIQGHASAWKGEVSEYLGIPYAKPPVGKLRFAPPRPFHGNGTVKAEKFSPDCPANVRAKPGQQISYSSVASTVSDILAQAGDTFDEDCLTLNIWTKPQSGEKAKAVMFWIYGGGFSTGNSASPAYNGARLANEKDVVVVTINYRVNIFGFPGASFIQDLNPGMLDQRLALEWVRSNIAKFGGDPKRIVLFGESAGGASVDYHSFAWTKDPIATGYIAESGSASNRGTPGQTKDDTWYAASSKLGCGDKEQGEKTLACMRTKKFTEILNAIKGSSFGPTVDNKVIFSDYDKRRAEGNFVKAPILIGNNNNEGGLTTMLSKGNPGSPKGAAPPVSLNSIGCPVGAGAKARRDKGVNAWRYVYSGEWPNQDIGIKGAWHGAEIGMVFGTSSYMSHKPDTEDEKKLVDKVMTAWSTFAKDPVNGLVKLGWPLYDASKPTVVRIGGPNTPEVAFEASEKHDSGCTRRG